MRAVLCCGNKVYLMNYINAKHTTSLDDDHGGNSRYSGGIDN
jgi:hypothetical protein